MNPEWLESVARCQLHYNLPGDYLFKNKNKEEDRNQETVKLSGLRGLEFRIWSSKCKSFSLPLLGG